LSHARGHVYRSLLEATAYGVRHNLEVMHEAGARPGRIVAVGGGTKGDLWPQIVSDTTGEAQVLPAEKIGASFGDAFLAGVGLGLVDRAGDWNSVETTVDPREENGAIYDRLYRIYRDLYPATAEQAHALADLQAAR
jgi:xylulokinase